MSRSKQKSISKVYNHYSSTPFRSLPCGLIMSPEFNLLSSYAKNIYFIMLTKWRPREPKEGFSLTYSEIHYVTEYCNDTINKSIKELILSGFIELSGRIPVGKNHMNEYKLNTTYLSKKYPKKFVSLHQYKVDNMITT